MSFKRVGAVILLVSDMENSIRFYKETLNLPLNSQSEDWTEFFSNGTVLALHPAKKKNTSKTGSNTLIGFMVDDLDATAKYLNEKNIYPALHYPVPCHLQKAYAHLNYKTGDCPNSEYLATHCLSLPMYAELKEEEIDYVISVLNQY